MAKVTFRGSGRAMINRLKKSDEVADQLAPLAEKVFDAVKQDPNEAYVASLRVQKFVTSGPTGRVSWQVGANPVIGLRVEAKRGTMRRALGLIK